MQCDLLVKYCILDIIAAKKMTENIKLISHNYVQLYIHEILYCNSLVIILSQSYLILFIKFYRL